ncbi:MAG TPA: cytochrome c3 family protein [Rubricoccaceae bacterium]|nr:cytochrome c3 family protein [Rubricoccaceae bacterium]
MLALAAASDAHAQLISPGSLTQAHAGLEGVRNCTSCHQLGQRGIEPQKCLDCHTPIRDRIARRQGFHARVSRQCGSCHKDHAGRRFNPIRFEGGRFDHSQTGFRLVGQHFEAECRDCHQPARITDAAVRRFIARGDGLVPTYLGLPRECGTCHRDDNPHGNSFAGQSCGECHNPSGWGDASGFNHAATGFPLTGPHARLDCESCHGTSGRFEGLSQACQSCHRPDSPHGNQFAGRDCDACHTVQSSWGSVPNFNHQRTDFPLVGRHVQVACGGCHPGSGGNRQFEGVPHGTCETCHEDPHDDAFGNDCATCHTPAGWEQMAASFDEERFDHEAHTGFALIGAHADLDCQSCHRRPARNDELIRIAFTGSPGGDSFPAVAHETCLSCHRDYHEGEFENNEGGAVCNNCHTQNEWTPTTFDVARHAADTDFPLTGAHLAVPCTACHVRPGHTKPLFDLDDACQECHADENPHGTEFADDDGVTACAECHNTTEWDLAQFDHDQTGFPLTGRHQTLACESCHTRETRPDGRVVRRFTGLDEACASCHAEDNPHRDQFEGRACNECHDTQAFTIAQFDHDRTRFPLDGAHERVPCGSCHRPERAPDGASFIRFLPLGTACADCHAGR